MMKISYVNDVDVCLASKIKDKYNAINDLFLNKLLGRVLERIYIYIYIYSGGVKKYSPRA